MAGTELMSKQNKKAIDQTKREPTIEVTEEEETDRTVPVTRLQEIMRDQQHLMTEQQEMQW